MSWRWKMLKDELSGMRSCVMGFTFVDYAILVTIGICVWACL